MLAHQKRIIVRSYGRRRIAEIVSGRQNARRRSESKQLKFRVQDFLAE